MPLVRHPERVFLREGSRGSGTYSNKATFRRSFMQKDAFRMTYLGSYRGFRKSCPKIISAGLTPPSLLRTMALS